MKIVDICSPLRFPWDRPMDRCFRIFPCLADPGRRSSLCLKFALVTIHLVYAGVLFLFDGDLIEKTKKEPWYTAVYLLMYIVTLIQYFVTSISSPGYVLDAMRAVNERNVVYRKTSETSNQPASSRNGSFIVAMEGNQTGRNISGNNATSWTKLVASLYPSGTLARTYTCAYCNVEQPPRTKHCHDCDKCVLQFDHHCVWLGNCIGQGNHCQFWWYLCEETALSLWTGVLYISYLKAHITRVWWQDAIIILLLIALSICLIFLLLLLLFHSYLILTNQTTYELVRRRRINYLRAIPERVHPFSKGVCRNLYNFCCARSSVYSMEPLPTPQQIEENSRPYTCLDTVTCRCC
ncbi:protein S-acyltransferase 10 [Gastrolobium bilobum]|uniref:protein S-acyltransferase 10 n=1 Tax=Gastrolobium bilobum TaxID=150636 RepID=UPI002AB31B78|nr:protein S-acyltransferase 10 [Gastrolobium bilobum]XP_061346045.1 protein S-acyltransferase 10 [Gastrolobium bilobum]